LPLIVGAFVVIKETVGSQDGEKISPELFAGSDLDNLLLLDFVESLELFDAHENVSGFPWALVDLNEFLDIHEDSRLDFDDFEPWEPVSEDDFEPRELAVSDELLDAHEDGPLDFNNFESWEVVDLEGGCSEDVVFEDLE